MTEPVGAHAAPEPEGAVVPIRPNREVRRKLKKSAFREQAAEKLGLDLSYEIEYDNGTTIVVESPLFASDDTTKKMDDIQNNRDLDRDENGEIVSPPTIGGLPAEPQPVRLARAIIGDEQHARLVAAPDGSSSDVMLAYRLLAQERPAVDDDPKSSEQ